MRLRRLPVGRELGEDVARENRFTATTGTMRHLDQAEAPNDYRRAHFLGYEG